MRRQAIESPFTASEFTATEWSTPADKARFANDFVHLTQAGFPQSRFTERFYRQISNCFGHIAHYNRGGFYDEQLSTPERRLRFLRQALDCPVYGDPAYTYSDVEAALKAWLAASPYVRETEQAVAAATEQRERALLARLQSKYGGAAGEAVPQTDGRVPQQFLLF